MFGVCHNLVLAVLFGQGFCLAWGRYRRRPGGAFGSFRRLGTSGQGYVQGMKQVLGCEVDPRLGFGGIPSSPSRTSPPAAPSGSLSALSVALFRVI